MSTWCVKLVILSASVHNVLMVMVYLFSSLVITGYRICLKSSQVLVYLFVEVCHNMNTATY